MMARWRAGMMARWRAGMMARWMGVMKMSKRSLRRMLSVAAVAVAVLGGLLVVSSSSPAYPLSADFASAQGLFPGAAVKVLGVTVGSVTDVQNVGDHVRVSMKIDAGTIVPAAVHASLVAEQLLGEPSVDLAPAFTGGRRLAPGNVIPEAHTSVPVSANQMLRAMQSFLGKINPQATGDLVHYLAQDLRGQGAGLNSLIHNAAGTLQLLAAKGDEIGNLETALARLTGALRSHTAAITALIQEYDTVSSVVAANHTQLAQGITELVNMSGQLAALLDPNLSTIQQEVPVITTAGRTIDRNIASLDETMSSAVALFAAAGRAYDPTHHWLNLNNQLPPGLAGSIVAGLVRDRLAGVCRRLLAHHSQGLSAAQIATLKRCGNPYSGFFDGILGYVPGIIGRLAGASGSGGSSASAGPSGSAAGSGGTSRSVAPTAAQLFATGLGAIPGLSSSERSSLAGAQPPGTAQPGTAPGTAQPGTASPGRSSTGTSPGTAPGTAQPGTGPGTGLLGSPDQLLGPLPKVAPGGGAGGPAGGGANAGGGGGAGGPAAGGGARHSRRPERSRSSSERSVFGSIVTLVERVETVL